jgi:YfiH family protein
MARFYFSSSYGGVSSSNFSSLNLADHVGDRAEDVARNREIVRGLLGLRSLHFMNQVHGSAYEVITESSRSTPTCDALITSERSIGLAVMTADCIPVLIDGGNSVAAVHVGRRGLQGGVITETVRAMQALGSVEFKAILGPAICGKCYEVDQEMFEEISTQLPATSTPITPMTPSRSSKSHTLDLPAGAVEELSTLGISAKIHHICTLENVDFFSYRRSSVTGRIAGVISL